MCHCVGVKCFVLLFELCFVDVFSVACVESCDVVCCVEYCWFH